MVMRRMVAWVVAASSACGGGGSGDDEGSSGEAVTGGPVTDATSGAPATGEPTSADTGAATSTGPGPEPTTGGTGSSGESSDGGESSSGDETGQVTNCADECHYVRAGAAGSGADWADAMPTLPDALERGHVYFVAAGDYPGYTFDDPEAGDAEIRVLRASDDDHGTDVGWDPAYAGGEAVFGEIAVMTGRHRIDGRGAARAVGGFQSTVVAIGGSAVTFRGFDVDGAFQLTDGKHTGGACTGMGISGDDVVVAANRIHDAADDGVVMSGLVNLSFAGNIVHTLHGCGTDGDCGPCYNGHSDGLELFDVKNSEIVGNMIYGITSTSAVFFGNWADELGMGPAEYCEDVLLANNILYSPGTGFVAYIEDARGIQVLHNVMWGLHQGAYGGLSIGTHVADLDIYNNAILSINYKHIGGTYDPAQHRGDYNLFAYSLGQWQDGPHDVVAADPKFAAIPGGEGPAVDAPQAADFAPQVDSPLRDAGFAGDADIVLPAVDYFGAPRNETPNLGAIE